MARCAFAFVLGKAPMSNMPVYHERAQHFDHTAQRQERRNIRGNGFSPFSGRFQNHFSDAPYQF
ncbi:MAG: hypothetical protein JO316_24910 [Abitibacteriaceae bacterium]|nr:hypothetical protein [Abditibacteriaceae bacterium]MBV9868609.1 hypothetical protein [Abditibacteriaceae bacterium]